MVQRRPFVLLTYAFHTPHGWRSVVDIHHGHAARRWVRDDGGVQPYLTLIGPEPGLHITDWCLREFGLTRLLDWTDIGLVDGARMWRSEALGSERFETLIAEIVLVWGESDPERDFFTDYNPTLYPHGPFSEAVS